MEQADRLVLGLDVALEGFDATQEALGGGHHRVA
jgi:hypothetical protein